MHVDIMLDSRADRCLCVIVVGSTRRCSTASMKTTKEEVFIQESVA